MKESNYATHQKVLRKVLTLVDKPVLELGSGYYSTPLINEMLRGKNIFCLTIDHDRKWLDKFTSLAYKYHSFQCYTESELRKFWSEDNTAWGLVFIDYGSWKIRRDAVRRYLDVAEYIIVHDVDYFASNKYFGKVERPFDMSKHDAGSRTYNDVFKQWIEYMPENWVEGNPPTLLGSNLKSLKHLRIPQMLVVNQHTV